MDSILEAVLTVSPNRQYLGMVSPTTPATHDPEHRHTHIHTHTHVHTHTHTYTHTHTRTHTHKLTV